MINHKTNGLSGGRTVIKEIFFITEFTTDARFSFINRHKTELSAIAYNSRAEAQKIIIKISK